MFQFDEPFGSSIFCDDIRQEVGGKPSYMGVYQGIIYLPSFPIAFGKFGIAIILNEPMELVLKRDWPVPVMIYLPGDKAEEPSIKTELPPDLENMRKGFENVAYDLDPDIPRMGVATMNLVLSPLNLNQAGLIKVRVDYQGQIIKLGSIRVALQEPDQPPS